MYLLQGNRPEGLETPVSGMEGCQENARGPSEQPMEGQTRGNLPATGAVARGTEWQPALLMQFLSMLSVWLGQHRSATSSTSASRQLQEPVWDGETGNSSAAAAGSWLAHPGMLHPGDAKEMPGGGTNPTWKDASNWRERRRQLWTWRPTGMCAWEEQHSLPVFCFISMGSVLFSILGRHCLATTAGAWEARSSWRLWGRGPYLDKGQIVCPTKGSSPRELDCILEADPDCKWHLSFCLSFMHRAGAESNPGHSTVALWLLIELTSPA